MEHLARRLVAGFNDPYTPNFCTACVFSLRGYLKSESVREYKAALRVLRKDNHDLLTSIMLFLTTMRTDEMRAPLTAQLKSEMVQCSIRPGHAEHTAALLKTDLLECAVIFLFDLIHESFAGTVGMLRKQSFSRNGLWPTCEADVLPLGAGASCPALLRWFTKLHECQVFMAFMDIFLLCPGVMITIIDSDMMRFHFLRTLSSHLDLAVSDHARWPHRSDEDDSQAPLSIISHLSVFLQAVAVGVGPSVSNPFQKLIRGTDDRLINSVIRAADVARDPDARKRLHNFVLNIYDARGTAPDAMPAFLRERLAERLERSGGSFESAYDVLRTFADRRICAAPGCGKPEHEMDRRLLVCAQCHMLRYCSRECQKLHWKTGTRPHKGTCALLKDLFQIADLKLEQKEWAKACRDAHVPLETIARIYDGLQGDQSGLDDVEANVNLIIQTLKCFDLNEVSEASLGTIIHEIRRER